MASLTLIKYIPSTNADPEAYSVQEDVPLVEADGVMFVCPQCSDGHRIEVWFRDRGLPDLLFRGWEGAPPKGWVPSGTSVSDLSLTPSVWLKKSCGWHGWVKGGKAA